MVTLKAISVRPPWPYAIFHLGKDHENRDWRSGYRGPLLIHAAKTWDQKGYEFLVERMGLSVPSERHHIFGALQGRVNMVDCVGHSESKWFFGNYGFVFEDPEEFQEPIPLRGMPGIFDVPEDIFEVRKSIPKVQTRLF